MTVVTRRRPGWGLTSAAAVVALAFVGPLAYVAWRNLTTGADLWSELRQGQAFASLGRTVVLATTVSAGAAVLGTTLAWLLTRSDVPGRRLWRVLVPLPLVFPSFVGALAFLNAFAEGGLVEEWFGVRELVELRGWFGAWLVLVLFTQPYVYLPVAARLAALPPSLEESARLLGRSPRSVFRTVVLPQTSGAVWAGTLLVFLYTVSEFGAVQLMGYRTLTVEIFANRLFDQERAFGLALVLGLLALAVATAERVVGRRRARTEVGGGRRPLQVGLGAWRWPALGLVGGVVGLGLMAPVVALGHWAVRGLQGERVGRELADSLGDLTLPAANTALVSLAAAAVAAVVVLPVAYLTTRHRTRTGGVANAVVASGFALPGLVVALALVFWTLNTPGVGALYQTVPVLIFAYVVHFGAQSMRAAQVAVGGIPHRLEDAARTLGAGPVRRFATIDVPLMLPGLLAGAGLVLLSTMKELPATLVLRPTSFETLALRIWDAQEGGFLGEVGVAATVLVLGSAVLTWLLVVRRADRFA
ncbi:MAG TPA: iron ABC transporter permease [Acidimicrobiales bacterium]|nr:iron ABC transporter permease [Acidimicrobiales bacterium]